MHTHKGNANPSEKQNKNKSLMDLLIPGIFPFNLCLLCLALEEWEDVSSLTHTRSPSLLSNIAVVIMGP